MEIFNAEAPEEKVSFSFVAIGQNNDPAKAKGSAETYALKYFLSKLFLIPVKDEMDPDYRQEDKKDRMTSEEQKKVNEFLKKTGWDERKIKKD